MLTIEKSISYNKIRVNFFFKNKNTFFTPTFLMALCIAIVIHTAPLYLFKITIKNLNDSDNNFLPVNLEIAPEQFTEGFDSQIVEIDRLLLSKYSLVMPPKKQIELIKSEPEAVSTFLFSNLYSKEFQNMEIENSSEFIFKNSPIELSISTPRYIVEAYGELKNKMKEINCTEYIESSCHLLEQFMVSFDVIVDNLSGEILYYENKEASMMQGKKSKTQLNELLTQAEEVLKTLKFERDPKNSYSHGSIEMTFSGIKK